MWIGLVPSTMWMRERTAPASASAAASMSTRCARDERRDGRRLHGAATARTPSKSPGDAPANPASITSTPSALELLGDLRLLVRPQRDARGLLPVAQRRIEDLDPAGHEHFLPSPGARRRTYGVNVGVCGYESRVFVCSP